MTDKQLLAFAIFSLFILNPTSSQPSPGPTSTSKVYCWDSGTIVSSNPSGIQYYQSSDLTSFQTWWSNLGSKSTSCKVNYKNDFIPSAGNLTDCTIYYTNSSNWQSTNSFRCPVIAFLNSLSNYDSYCSPIGNCTQYDVSNDSSDVAFTTLINGSGAGNTDCQEYQLLMGLNVMYISYLAKQIACLTAASQAQSILGNLDTLLKSTIAIAILGSSSSVSTVTNNPYIYYLMSNGNFNLSSPLHDTNWSPNNYTKSTNLFYNFSNSSIYTSSSINTINYGNANYQATLLTDMSNSVQVSAGCLC